MSNSKVSALTAATTISAGDLLYLAQGGVSKKLDYSLISSSINNSSVLTGTPTTPTPATSTNTTQLANTAFVKSNIAQLKTTLGATWVGAGGAVTTPINNVYVLIPASGTISKVTVLTQGGNGSCLIDVFNNPYSAYPSTTSICGTSKPTISSGIKYQDSTLSTWSTSVSEGDILGFNLISTSTFTNINIILSITPA